MEILEKVILLLIGVFIGALATIWKDKWRNKYDVKEKTKILFLEAENRIRDYIESSLAPGFKLSSIEKDFKNFWWNEFSSYKVTAARYSDDNIKELFKKFISMAIEIHLYCHLSIDAEKANDYEKRDNLYLSIYDKNGQNRFIKELDGIMPKIIRL